ncbi:MAG: sulfatase-like hydrolase/transferase [Bryobacterales bacterium]|nr:sulfatase-like hydrolase/transferase [Bryobacterales bacterium]
MTPDRATPLAKAEPWWHNAAVALALANLCLLRVWMVTPPHLNREDTGLLEQPFPPAHYAALIINMALVTGVIWVWLRWSTASRGWPRRVALGAGSLLLLVVICYHLRFVLQGFTEKLPLFGVGIREVLLRPLPLLALSLTGGALAWSFARFAAVRAGARHLLLLLAVPAMFNLGIAGRMMFYSVAAKPVAKAVPAKGIPAKGTQRAVNRVVIALFDEWDHRLTFEKRDAELALPEIDRFRAESVHASNAIRGGRRTLASIAAMTTGLPVDDVEVGNHDNFTLKLPGAASQWQQTSTLFSSAHEAGYAAAVVGWYFPYCRMFGSSLAGCWTWPFYWSSFPAVDSLSGSVGRQLYMTTDLGALSPWPEPLDSRVSRVSRFAVLEKAKQIAADRSYDLVYLHLPMTHFPYFYDPKTRAWGERRELPSGYSSGLAFADRAVGEIRAAMEKSGAWDTSVVLLTADHQLRFNVDTAHRHEKRVPLLIHMPGQTADTNVKAPIPMTVLRDLTFSMLKGDLSTPEKVATYLENLPKPREFAAR